jgi:hypothetical protein
MVSSSLFPSGAADNWDVRFVPWICMVSYSLFCSLMLWLHMFDLIFSKMLSWFWWYRDLRAMKIKVIKMNGVCIRLGVFQNYWQNYWRNPWGSFIVVLYCQFTTILKEVWSTTCQSQIKMNFGYSCSWKWTEYMWTKRPKNQ